MSSRVRAKFLEFFSPPAVEAVTETDDSAELLRLANDAKLFIETQAYKDFRKALQAQIDSCYSDPRMGTDAAAAFALKQAGLRESMIMLDRVVSRYEVKDGI